MTSFSDLPQLLVVAAVAAGLVGAATYRRRRRAAVLDTPRGRTALGKIVYGEAPTVQVVDARRVDRVRRVVRINVGTHVDLIDALPGLNPLFRVHAKSISRRGEAEEVAHLRVEFGGVRISCGPLIEELGYNEFLIPAVRRDEPRSCLVHYVDDGNSHEFMRLGVRAVDAAAGTVELDILQISEQWPATAGA